MATNNLFSHAKCMNFNNASFANIGHDQVNTDNRVYGTQNNNHGEGPQYNYSGKGQFINHGRDQNVNTGKGNFRLSENDVHEKPFRALGFGENRVLDRHVSEDNIKRNPFHQFNRPASRRPRTDAEILAWTRTIVGDEKRSNHLLTLRETKAEWALEDMQRASYSPDCDPSLKGSMLHVMIWLSEASGRCVQSHYNPNVQKLGSSPISSKGVSFADVWKGTIDGTSQAEVVSLKVVRPRYTSQVGEKLKRNMREIMRWRTLDHLNVVPFIGNFYFGSNPQEICLVTPWMENGNLVEYLRRNPTDSDLKRFSFAWDVASGLDYLHESSITHGNLKGHNVLITPDEVACLTDFGLFDILDAGYIRPTPWCAPEVLVEGSISQKSDIYAYGCVCHEIFAGRTPFHNLSEDELYHAIVFQNQLPERPLEVDAPMLWELMEQCWSTDPSSRPTASDMVKSLQEMVSLFNSQNDDPFFFEDFRGS
ncbi:hypothetical protein E1B28_003400 [Marasmius oreades]|uniref:Protein kinase domain-containing protein n=1 Tax=Marasmius oreades TaxID=181124 RepID=A0A9P7RM56_9AGAR|nr:uncharacterized protein E1B28_003400 [Marasmius oreades]KAG7085867.1 hypothetical protein E1B28_003400 [Marasmius oreades]